MIQPPLHASTLVHRRLGFQYNFARRVTLHAEWDRYRKVGDGNTGQFDIDLHSIGVLFRF